MEKLVNDLKKSNDQYHFINSLSISQLEKLYEYTNERYRNDNPVISDSLYDMIEFIVV